MCGIAGLIADRPDLVEQALPSMVHAMVHRGPDDEGIAYRRLGHSFVGLGFRRLSILDLSAAGHQPMIHPRTGSCLIFNGEIYNFRQLRRELEAEGARLTSQGDSEVLLHALEHWGPACLDRLQGMYAFAWLDGKGERLLLARDPLGIKPLYVARLPHAFLFASEVRALLASGLVPRKLDQRGLAGLLAYGSVQHPCTMVQGVFSFPAGHSQTLEGIQGAAPRPFFRFPGCVPKQSLGTSGADAVAALPDTLAAAVRDHLVSDVPVGVFLSSGLDSTLIAALGARSAPRLRSFTVGFKEQAELSESEQARETANRLGLEHTDILVTPSDALELAQNWLDMLDQPSVDGLNVYIISGVVRRAGITVALSGQGGDELFGGYPSFVDVPRLLRMRRRIDWLPSGVRRVLGTTAALHRNSTVREKLGDMAAGRCRILDLYLHRRRTLSDRQMARLGLDASALGLTPTFQPPEAIEGLPEGGDPVWLTSQFEMRFYQGNVLLRDGDANSMAHSLELRVPLLDRRLLDLILPLPGSVRLPNRRPDKHLLRQVLRSVVNTDHLPAAKRGFCLPVTTWMNTALRGLSEAALASLKATGLFRAAGIDAIWKQFLTEPNGPAWSRAFTLVVLGHYLKRTGLN
jgi:asparagine synthase (glutamine-hydrolysing)